MGGGGALQSAAEIYETTKVHSQPDFQSLDKKKDQMKVTKKNLNLVNKLKNDGFLI
jgi:hypothetical protein